MHKRSRDIPENQRVIVLTGLIGTDSGIGPIDRIELVFPDVGNSGGLSEEESLDRNHVNRVDPADSIHIGRR